MNKLIHLRYPGGFYSGTYSLWLFVIDLYAFVALHAIGLPNRIHCNEQHCGTVKQWAAANLSAAPSEAITHSDNRVEI